MVHRTEIPLSTTTRIRSRADAPASRDRNRCAPSHRRGPTSTPTPTSARAADQGDEDPIRFSYYPIALAVAYRLSSFGYAERSLIYQAVCQCAVFWDPSSGEPWEAQAERFPLGFHLSNSAEQSGFKLAYLRRALRNLVKSRVLYSGNDGRLRLNGGFAEWTNLKTGERQLTPNQVEYCQGFN